MATSQGGKPLAQCYSFLSDNVIGAVVGVAWTYLLPYLPDDDPYAFLIVLANDVLATAAISFIVYRITKRCQFC